MSEVPIDLKLLVTLIGVVIPLCIWASRYFGKVHKKIHKRLDVIEDHGEKANARLDSMEKEIEHLMSEEVIRKLRVRK